MIDTESTVKRPPPPAITGRGGSSATYRELPEGMFRFVIGEPKIRQLYSEKYSKWTTLVDFPLTLTDAEKKRVVEEYGDPPEGTYQSNRPAFGGFSCGYTLNANNSGKESALTTFLACAFGQANSREFRKWVEAGGCPTITATDHDGQIAQVESWLRWVEGSEIYMTIKHSTSNNGGILARAGGPMAVGSLPGGPKEPDYQATMKGKLRAMLAEETRPSAAEEGVAEGAALAAAEFGEQPAETQQAEHDFRTCRCDDCSETLRAKAAEMFGSASAA